MIKYLLIKHYIFHFSLQYFFLKNHRDISLLINVLVLKIVNKKYRNYHDYEQKCNEALKNSESVNKTWNLYYVSEKYENIVKLNWIL